MADHIPFLTGEDGVNLIGKVYPDSEYVRIPLDRAEKFVPKLPKGCKVWIDTSVDGIDDIDIRRERKAKVAGEEKMRPTQWFTFMQQFPHFEKIAKALHAPVEKDVTALVFALLDKCLPHQPAWIAVPQTPLKDGSERNKINRFMATAAGQWKTKNKYSGQLILPIVFSSQWQVNGKTARNPKVEQAERCYHAAQCDGFWAVERSLCDDSGAGTLGGVRFPGIVRLHEELNAKIPSRIRIAGPYWGLNLLLWARGLVDFPAIGVGSGYQFFLAGGPSHQGDVKIPIPSLRRRVAMDPQLKPWLVDVIAKLGDSHPTQGELKDILKHFTLLSEREHARERLAVFYKQWYNLIAGAPKAGRSMALFQDLSAAYALGRTLPDIASDKIRRPEAVAEPLMVNCL